MLPLPEDVLVGWMPAGGQEGGGTSVGERAPVLEKLSNEHATAA